MHALELVKLPPLMERTRGRPEIVIALIDGPVRVDHPDLERNNVRQLAGNPAAACSLASSAACVHGTFVAGVLSAKRGSLAPAICPGCTLIIRPIFSESVSGRDQTPTATPNQLADAITDAVNAGASLVNMSLSLAQSPVRDEGQLEAALDYAASRSVITIVAAGNQRALGRSVLASHPWVLPVIACDHSGLPTASSNLSGSIGKRGLSAPGTGVSSIGTDGRTLIMDGTSGAAAFVTGTAALLWSEFPRVSASMLKLALTQITGMGRRVTLVPPLLNAWAAFQHLAVTA